MISLSRRQRNSSFPLKSLGFFLENIYLATAAFTSEILVRVKLNLRTAKVEELGPQFTIVLERQVILFSQKTEDFQFAKPQRKTSDVTHFYRDQKVHPFKSRGTNCAFSEVCILHSRC